MKHVTELFATVAGRVRPPACFALGPPWPVANLVKANTSTVCIVAKSSAYHVESALGTTLDEGVAMVDDSVDYLTNHGLEVLLDAEHFFDGFKANPEFSLRVLEAAVQRGATTLVLCDTNGGSLPHDVYEAVKAAVMAQGLSLITDDPVDGRLEATAKSFWYGLTDDVVVRVRPDAKGSRLDLRSIGRDPGPDQGRNCARIGALIQAVKGP